jgi:hypothetical protein
VIIILISLRILFLLLARPFTLRINNIFHVVADILLLSIVSLKYKEFDQCEFLQNNMNSDESDEIKNAFLSWFKTGDIVSVL